MNRGCVRLTVTGVAVTVIPPATGAIVTERVTDSPLAGMRIVFVPAAAVNEAPASVSTVPSAEMPTTRHVPVWPSIVTNSSPRPKRSELSPTMSSWPKPPKIVSSPPLPSM